MGPRARRRSSIVLAARLVLAALAVGGLIVESAHLPHLHGDETSGLYNEQHVLATLLATVSGAALPEAPAAILLAVLAGLVALLEGVRPSVAAARHAASRAPPLR
jgi:hypothetical protein